MATRSLRSDGSDLLLVVLLLPIIWCFTTVLHACRVLEGLCMILNTVASAPTESSSNIWYSSDMAHVGAESAFDPETCPAVLRRRCHWDCGSFLGIEWAFCRSSFAAEFKQEHRALPINFCLLNVIRSWQNNVQEVYFSRLANI